MSALRDGSEDPLSAMLAPWAARDLAIPHPMPLDDPVISAVLPSREEDVRDIYKIV